MQANLPQWLMVAAIGPLLMAPGVSAQMEEAVMLSMIYGLLGVGAILVSMLLAIAGTVAKEPIGGRFAA